MGRKNENTFHNPLRDSDVKILVGYKASWIGRERMHENSWQLNNRNIQQFGHSDQQQKADGDGVSSYGWNRWHIDGSRTVKTGHNFKSNLFSKFSSNRNIGLCFYIWNSSRLNKHSICDRLSTDFLWQIVQLYPSLFHNRGKKFLKVWKDGPRVSGFFSVTITKTC